jgi:zinc transport system substrate-binding protein
MRLIQRLLILVVVTGFAGCSDREAPAGRADAPDTSPLSVYVVNYPLQYFAERIGGELVEVVFPATGDVDPAYWSPEPETAAAYQQADLVLLNGAGYAKWIRRTSLSSRKLIDTSAAFRDRYIPLEDAVAHTHGPAGAHAHEGLAFTTWLDPVLAMGQARAIAEAFEAVRPDSEVVFRERFGALEADLQTLDQELSAAANAIGDQPLLFSHPVYQYLIRRYRLNGRSLHWEPDEAPSTPMWRELEELLEDHPARWMIWEGTPEPETVLGLQRLGIQSAVFEPAGNVPAAGDFLSVMSRNAAVFQTVSAKSGAPPSGS